MTRRFSLAAALAAMLAAGPALADHMNGQYAGTGQAQGLSLILRQQGVQIQGQLSSGGMIQAQSDGGNNFQGAVQIPGVGYGYVMGAWSQQGIMMQIVPVNAQGQPIPQQGMQLFFASQGGQQMPQVPNQFPQVPNQFPQVPNQFPQQPNQFPQAPNQFPQVPNQFPQNPNQFPQVPNQFPQDPNQFPQMPNQFPQAPNQFPQVPPPLPQQQGQFQQVPPPVPQQ